MSAKTKLTSLATVRSIAPVSPLRAPSAAMPSLSVVIPTLDEAENIGDLLRRLDATMRRYDILYEAIIVDDHSSDDTVAVARRAIAALRAPARVIVKRGKPGKTHSLIQGLDLARYEALAMLDGDLQYAPEELPALLGKLTSADVVVGDRRASYQQADPGRGRVSRVFNTIIGRGMLALDTDVQSGMKVFRREVYETALLRPGPWSFDLELLTMARENGYRIANSPIATHARAGGVSKLRIAPVAGELSLRALAVRLRLATHTAAEDDAERERLAVARGQATQTPVARAETPREQARRYERWLSYEAAQAERERASGAPARYAEAASREVVRPGRRGERRYRPFAPHQPEYSALTTFARPQVIALGLLAVAWIAAVVAFGLTALAVTLGIVTALYLADLAITTHISIRTLQRRVTVSISDEVARAVGEEYWPSYTILCPLYHEAEVAGQFVNAMRLLDYPTDRLQVLFLTEEDDRETRAALLAMGLPRHFTVVTVPDGGPRTKPRACNYGLMQATGDFVVIFDAEDIPDPLQLKKAALTFAHYDERLACVQASLNFYNPTQNALTRWFTSEYSLWFDLTLPALQRMKSFLPLGGTSNHFRTRALREVGGWDPFNVTEDCDLGVRLSQFHYRTAMVDSTTYEEANPNLRNWLRQRSRWVKGYMQTYLTHMRNPMRYLREGRLSEFFWLQVIVGGKPLAQLVNPLLWALLATYVVFHKWVTPIYHVLYPAPVFYASAFCLVVGNFFYVYSYLIGCLNRRQYLLALWSLAIPLYWALMSVASYIALYQLLTRPFYWEKTTHGLATAGRGRGPTLGGVAARAAMALGGALVAAALVARSLARLLVAPLAWAARPVARPIAIRAEWAAYPLMTSALARGARDYLTHELTMLRRDLERGRQQEAILAPALALPVAPVVDMLSTVMVPALPVVAPPVPARRVVAPRQRETTYLAALRPLEHTLETRARARRAPLRWLRDRWLMTTLGATIAASLIAFAYYFSHGDLLLYRDANSHLRLARLPLDAVTPGLAQLGSAWLPLPHMLMWPFIWNDYLWQSGLAGAFVGMSMFVVAAIFVFKSARLLSGSGAAAFVGTLAFILNPNLLYLQTTPLSEATLLAVSTATLYMFLLWTRTGQTNTLLAMAGCATLAVITRYEGWSLFFAVAALMVVVNIMKRRGLRRIIGEALVFVTPGSAAIGLWLLWGLLLTGNPLFFKNGPYSAGEQQAILRAEGYLPTYHNPRLDLLTYGADVLEYAGPLVVALALVGLVVWLLRAWRRPEGVASLAMIAPLSLYLLSLYSGTIVLYVPGVASDTVPNPLFNVRYATIAMIPVAVFLATLVGRRRLLGVIVVALLVTQTIFTSVNGIVSLQDGQTGMSCLPFTQTDLYLAEHYNGGRVLTDMYQNSLPYSLLGMQMSDMVYIGSYNVWGPALADPSKYVDWVVTRPGDAVSQELNVNSPSFTSQFVLVEQDSSGDQVFYKRGLPPLPNRAAPTQVAQQFAACTAKYDA